MLHQKQLFTGALSKSCFGKCHKIHRKALVLESPTVFKFIERAQQRCFPVDLAKYFRATICRILPWNVCAKCLSRNNFY